MSKTELFLFKPDLDIGDMTDAQLDELVEALLDHIGVAPEPTPEEVRRPEPTFRHGDHDQSDHNPHKDGAGGGAKGVAERYISDSHRATIATLSTGSIAGQKASMGGISETYTATVGDVKAQVKFSYDPDGAEREVMGFVIAQALGCDASPVTVREVDGREASVTEWVEGEVGRNVPGDKDITQAHAILDVVINNADRHDGNYFVRPDGTVVASDHNAAFREGTYVASGVFTAAHSDQPITSENMAALKAFRADEGLRTEMTAALGEEAVKWTMARTDWLISRGETLGTISAPGLGKPVTATEDEHEFKAFLRSTPEYSDLAPVEDDTPLRGEVYV